MVKLYPIVGAFLSFLALILLAVGVSTNQWVVLKRVDPNLNPTMTNAHTGSVETRAGKVSGLAEINYAVSHVGLWIACTKEHKGAVSCSYVGTKCNASICWIRRTTISSDKVCQRDDIKPITTCGAYIATRAIVLIGLILLTIGVATQLVSLLTVDRSRAMMAGLLIFIAGLCVMTSFAVFYHHERMIGSVGHFGYSFKLVIATWPICLCSGVLSCCAASMGLRHKEVSDYSASNY